MFRHKLGSIIRFGLSVRLSVSIRQLGNMVGRKWVMVLERHQVGLYKICFYVTFNIQSMCSSTPKGIKFILWQLPVKVLGWKVM